MLSLALAALVTGCGTDFAEPAPVSVRVETPPPVATVLRVIPVAPLPTATTLPPVVGPDGSVQRPFPPEIDPGQTSVLLIARDVIDSWRAYLSDARLIVADRRIDVHICADGRLIPASPLSVIGAGRWGFLPSVGEWHEVILGREFRRGRISGIVTLSRVGASTVALNDGVAVVSVTDSELCDDNGEI